MNRLGTLHLIPVSLGEAPLERWLPAETQAIAQNLEIYIAENAKTARAFLKQVEVVRPIQDILIHTLDKRGTPTATLATWLQPLTQGQDIGLVSEAGCPAVADPGAAVVQQAHRLLAPVRAHVGPSSILLSLMASGLSGQNFAFHGYPPVKADARAKQLREWEQYSKRTRQTQIFIETPYRNEALFAALLQELQPQTQLCIARALTTDEEWVRSQTVAQWRKQAAPNFAKHPCIFLFQA